MKRFTTLFLLLLIFAAPGMLAYWVYLHPQYLAAGTTNKGHLLTPPMRLTEFASNNAQKWRLLLWHADSCDQHCLQMVDRLARIRLALGRHLYAVEVGLMMAAHTSPLNATDAALLATKDVQQWRAQQPIATKETILIVNPAGYAILEYPVSIQSADIFHDLKHLLTKG